MILTVGDSKEWAEAMTAIARIGIAISPEKLQEFIELLEERAKSISNLSLSSTISKENTKRFQMTQIRYTIQISESIHLLSIFCEVLRERIPSVKYSIRNQRSITELKKLLGSMMDTLSHVLKIYPEIHQLTLDEVVCHRIASEARILGLAICDPAILSWVAVGVAAVSFAGFCFGIGVGLAIGATALGAAALIARAVYAQSEDLVKFRNCNWAMLRSTDSLYREIGKCQASTERAVTVLKRLEQKGTRLDMKDKEIVVICQTLDRLDTSAQYLHESLQTCATILDGRLKELKCKHYNIFKLYSQQ